ncbi:hypothetical protein GQR58_029092 [Nymphon striatum]|nr:hypothetical protein GQR58_029092 [Nymphon striatum]
MLVNADTNEDLFLIEEGMMIDINDLPTVHLDIRAITTDDVESVRLSLSGAITTERTESLVPYALFQDLPIGNYKGSDFVLGTLRGRGGIYKSTNNGESWMPSNSGLPNNPHILDLIVDQGIFYLSMHGGIFKSVDDGNSWSEIETGLLSGTYYSLFVKGPYIFAGNANGGITYSKDNAGSGIGGGLYESKNEGASWERIEINGVGPNGVGTLHLSNNIFYLTTDFDILTSEDNLISWNKVLSTSTTGIKILSFGNRVYATSSAGKYYYTDDSVNWILVQNSSTNNSVNNLWVFEEKTIMSTSEGLYESTDSGASWLFNNSGINALHIQSLYADVFSGSEGQGIFRSLDSGNSWTPINAGLNAVNSKTINEIIEIDGILYIATGGGIYSSANSGRTWERNLDLGINRSADVLAFTNGALVTGDDDSIFISNDYGENWTEKEIDILEQPISFLSLMAKDNMLVLGTVGGKILLSLNLGNTWSDISIPNEYYPSDFQLFEGDLMQHIQDVMVTSEGIIAASGNGLFVTREDLNIWYPVTNEFSQTMTKIILQEEALFAGTFGSSVWQLPLIDALAVLPEPEPNDFALRINTGGPEVIWSGDTFIADQYRTGGACLCS